MKPIYQNHFEVLDSGMKNALDKIKNAHQAKFPGDVNIESLTGSICDVIRLANDKDLDMVRRGISESLKNQLIEYSSDSEKLKNLHIVDSLIRNTTLWSASAKYTYER